MKSKLTIELDRDTYLFDHWKVSGFSDEEFSELLRLKEDQGYFQMQKRLVEIIDEHNPNQGTCWACGYGIYGVVFNDRFPGCVFVETGNSCD